jgi:hypothetical protein
VNWHGIVILAESEGELAHLRLRPRLDGEYRRGTKRPNGPAAPPSVNQNLKRLEMTSTTLTFTRKQAPDWLLAFWKEIDDKTFGKGFDCFVEDATCNLGVADWHGRETIRDNLRAFIDSGFTALHDVVEYWDGEQLKVFRGIVTMTPDDKNKQPVRPVMTHFFYMDDADPTKVRRWIGAVGPVAF